MRRFVYGEINNAGPTQYIQTYLQSWDRWRIEKLIVAAENIFEKSFFCVCVWEREGNVNNSLVRSNVKKLSDYAHYFIKIIN